MASYTPPNPYVPNAFNPTQFITPSDNITTKYLDENYLRFPFAQGTENFVSINNQGSLTQSGLADFTSNTTPVIFNLPPTITNPILDTATTPLNAVATIGYVLANEQGGSDLLPLDNDWSGLNNFNPTPVTGAITYPKGFNLANGILSANDLDLVCITPNNTFNAFNLFTQSSGVLNTASVPSIQISNNLGSITLNASSSLAAINLRPSAQVNISNDTNNASLVVNNNITATSGSISANTFNVNSYLLYTNTNPSIGLVIANTTGGNGTLTLSNNAPNSAIFTTLTATLDGLNISTAVNLPAQTYTPTITYSNVASTQQFVQQALASQGGGDAVLAGNNDFTGRNTFSFNSGGQTITNQGLTLARNVEVGNNELDLVSLNATSKNGLNIYCETTSVSLATTPKVQFFNDTTPTLFNTNVQLPTQHYNPTLNYGNIAATQSFVQQTIYEGVFNTTISTPLTSVTGWDVASLQQPSSFSFNQVFNQGQQTNSYYMFSYSTKTGFSTAAINFTCNFPTPLFPTGTTGTMLSGTGINFYSSQTLQSFNLNITILNQFQISVSSGGTTPNSATGKLTGQFFLSFT